MESILKQIAELAPTLDEAGRQTLMKELHNVAHSLEDSEETTNRYGYLHLETAAVKIGFDLGLFKILTEHEGPVSAEEIVKKTGADPVFLERFLRYISAVGAIDQVSEDGYGANKVTKNLTAPVAESGISHCFATIGPQFQALPSFLQKTKYQNPSDELHTVFQDAFNTPEHPFAWFAHQPVNLGYFNDYMASRREPTLSWLTVYPVLEETAAGAGADPTRPVYVNVGGGIGHQCKQFRDKFPADKVPGRVVLQDMPYTIANALPTPGVENMVHDFFQPQPVKDAKFYYTRGVLHNHPDHKVRLLLGHLRDAMAPDSVLLLDEWVLPPRGVSAYASAIDMTMMATFASVERSEAQWRKLIAESGLRLVKTYMYNPLNYESVMDVRLA